MCRIAAGDFQRRFTNSDFLCGTVAYRPFPNESVHAQERFRNASSLQKRDAMNRLTNMGAAIALLLATLVARPSSNVTTLILVRRAVALTRMTDGRFAVERSQIAPQLLTLPAMMSRSQAARRLWMPPATAPCSQRIRARSSARVRAAVLIPIAAADGACISGFRI